MVAVVVVVGRILLFLWLSTLATLKNMRQFYFIFVFYVFIHHSLSNICYYTNILETFLHDMVLAPVEKMPSVL